MDLFTLVCECLFPTQCVSCCAAGEWWCGACRTLAPHVSRNICVSCASVAREHACDGTSPLDGLVAAGFYHAKPLRVMLYALKYEGVTRVLDALPAYLASWKEARTEPWPWAGETSLAIQALPAAENRVRERGFDQAELIAERVRTDITPWAASTHLLHRTSASIAQASLAHGSVRDANIRGAFTVAPSISIPSVVLLVDDVVTTGSTMREAARVLKRAGVERVYGLALAVGA